MLTRLSVTLRMPERLLRRIEADARRRGLALDAWLVQVAESSLRERQAQTRPE